MIPSERITIVAIDSQRYNATEWAIRHTLKMFPNSPVMTISPKEFYKGKNKRDQWIECDPFDRKIHSVICLQGPIQYLETDYALFIQWDGMPSKPDLWRNEFLDYDYIGAPWIWFPEPFTVGNGGFSLRSRKLMELAQHLEPNYEETHESYWIEDTMIGLHNRIALKQQGIKFAPLELADQFSREYPVGPAKTFGFHHKNNAQHHLTPNQFHQWLKAVNADQKAMMTPKISIKPKTSK